MFALRTSRAPRALLNLSTACVPLIVIVVVFVSQKDSDLAREAIAVITFVLLMAVLGAIIGRMTIHLTISLAMYARLKTLNAQSSLIAAQFLPSLHRAFHPP